MNLAQKNFHLLNNKNKINAKVDLFNRNEKYEVVRIDESFPKYLLDNLLNLKII